MKKYIPDRNGFTILELLIASSISISIIGFGFFILQIALKGNKIDEEQMGLSGRLNDTLDFILDEVKVGKRIIDNETDVQSLNSNCKYPDIGEFLFGIRLPDQALAKDDYNPEGEKFNLNKIDCPIVYTLRESNSNEIPPYSLVRYGPQYNNKGYYISPSYKDYKETVLLDGITSDQGYPKISCPKDWNNIKTVKGITFCLDQFKKSIEIQIESEISFNNNLKSVASTGGFSLIQDENQISLTPLSIGKNSDIPSCNGSLCCWMGVCVKSNKITYIIDRSSFMNKEYKHPNGLIINGKWEEINDPGTILARINGKSLFETAISNLKQNIYRLPTSDTLSEDQRIFLQIIAINEFSEYLFEDGPKELTIANKVSALSYLDSLATEGETIDPWNDICTTLESEMVGQVIILSASIPLETQGNCEKIKEIVGTDGSYAELINDYNRITRSKTATGSLIIDSISLFHNFCEKSKNYANNNWLGSISSGDESICTHIK